MCLNTYLYVRVHRKVWVVHQPMNDCRYYFFLFNQDLGQWNAHHHHLGSQSLASCMAYWILWACMMILSCWTGTPGVEVLQQLLEPPEEVGRWIFPCLLSIQALQTRVALSTNREEQGLDRSTFLCSTHIRTFLYS